MYISIMINSAYSAYIIYIYTHIILQLSTSTRKKVAKPQSLCRLLSTSRLEARVLSYDPQNLWSWGVFAPRLRLCAKKSIRVNDSCLKVISITLPKTDISIISIIPWNWWLEDDISLSIGLFSGAFGCSFQVSGIAFMTVVWPPNPVQLVGSEQKKSTKGPLRR